AEAITPQNARKQPQAIGAGQALQFVSLRAGQTRLSRTAGDQQATLARTCSEIMEQLGQAAALLVGVWAAVSGGAIIELRQGALEVIPHHEHFLLLEDLDGPAALLGGRELLKPYPIDIGAEHLHRAVSAGELFEAQKAGAVAEQAATRPPAG